MPTRGLNGSQLAGFNSRLMGYTWDERFGYPCAPDHDGEAGFYYASKLISEGKVYYTHRFHHKSHGVTCKGYAFPYGVFWVCNDCRQKSVDDPWWTVKVYADGNAWCCVGLGFVDLQASDNYAFGKTREEALDNYEKQMVGDNVIVAAVERPFVKPEPRDAEIERLRAERDALVDAVILPGWDESSEKKGWGWIIADEGSRLHPTRDEAVTALMAHVMRENPMRPHDSTRQT